MAFAHALIEGRDGEKYQRGQEVPGDLPGIDELRESGAVSDEPYVEEDEAQVPDVVEVEGARYVRVEDSSDAGEESR